MYFDQGQISPEASSRSLHLSVDWIGRCACFVLHACYAKKRIMSFFCWIRFQLSLLLPITRSRNNRLINIYPSITLETASENVRASHPGWDSDPQSWALGTDVLSTGPINPRKWKHGHLLSSRPPSLLPLSALLASVSRVHYFNFNASSLVNRLIWRLLLMVEGMSSQIA